ncbi:MAG: uroporphyrinogen decarboxylase family protein [Candidatus Humimicrobiaceae bacterium]
MSSRDRIVAALSHKEHDRVPILEEIWPTTQKRWVLEGLPRNETFEEYFRIDQFSCLIFDSSFRFQEVTLDETSEYIIKKNSNGAVTKTFKERESTPQVISSMINTKEKWEETKHLMKFTPDRVNWTDIRSGYESSRKRDSFVHLNMQFGYERWADIVGQENYLIALAEDPEWIRDIHETDVRLFIEAYEEFIGRGFVFDGARFSCDMGYRNGPLFSPIIYQRVFQPGLKLLCNFFHEKGVFTILHSCGNVLALIPHIVNTGFDCLNPLEVKAGMDILMLKKKYVEYLCLMGGIDVRKMSEAPEVIEEEIGIKVSFAKQGGDIYFIPTMQYRIV